MTDTNTPHLTAALNGDLPRVDPAALNEIALRNTRDALAMIERVSAYAYRASLAERGPAADALFGQVLDATIALLRVERAYVDLINGDN